MKIVLSLFANIAGWPAGVIVVVDRCRAEVQRADGVCERRRLLGVSECHVLSDERRAMRGRDLHQHQTQPLRGQRRAAHW